MSASLSGWHVTWGVTCTFAYVEGATSTASLKVLLRYTPVRPVKKNAAGPAAFLSNIPDIHCRAQDSNSCCCNSASLPIYYWLQARSAIGAHALILATLLHTVTSPTKGFADIPSCASLVIINKLPAGRQSKSQVEVRIHDNSRQHDKPSSYPGRQPTQEAAVYRKPGLQVSCRIIQQPDQLPTVPAHCLLRHVPASPHFA